MSEWADRHRRLSSEASAEPGQWRTSRAPYQRGMMDAVNETGIHTIVYMTASQVGKTELLLNVLGYFVDQDPCPILNLQPTVDMANTFSKDRLSTMLRDTPQLQGIVAEAKSRDSGNTILHKVFPGGHITMTGANAPASLASRPIRIVLCDEVDRYPVSAGTEGDPIILARKRSATFFNRKLILTSTPTLKGFSRIESAWEQSDQRKFMVPCPKCGTLQPLEWSGIRWEKDPKKKGRKRHKPKTAHYVCAHCEAKIPESARGKMLAAGEWIATREAPGVAGFGCLPEIYSPWKRWAETVEEFLDAKRRPETLQAWTNTALGETWEDQGDQIVPTGIFARREAYAHEVPEGVLAITAGVDVQGDRWEVEVKGWGEGEESWNLDYLVVYGNPAELSEWGLLDEALQREWLDKDGTARRIEATCVDTGGLTTQQAYQYCRERKARRIFAIKGAANTKSGSLPIVSKPSPKKSGKRGRNVDLFTVGVDGAKALLYSRLMQEEAGPGYMHFPMERDEDYFAQIVAEKLVTKYSHGVPYRAWVLPPHRRNEVLDCNVYAYAALLILRPNLAIRRKRRETPPDEKPKQRPRKRDGFVSKYSHKSWRK